MVGYRATFSRWYASLQDPLYRNSFFIGAGRVFDGGFGFLFWILAARLYTAGQIGIATALIATTELIVTFSRLGFDFALIRFLPLRNSKSVVSTCFWITIITSLAFGSLYLLIVPVISPSLGVIRDHVPALLLFVAVFTITWTTGNAFLSFRRAEYRVIQNLAMGLRIPLLLPLVFLGSMGIFYAAGLSNCVSALLALWFLRRFTKLEMRIDVPLARETLSFSIQNYLGFLLQSIPMLIMPTLLLNLLRPEDVALYFIAFSLGNLVLIIPDAVSTSFFVEGSHGADLKKGIRFSLAGIYVLLVPVVCAITLGGPWILGIFGSEYVAASNLLTLVVLSSFFVTLYNLFIPLQNIRLKVSNIIGINAIRLLLLVGITLFLVPAFGIMGVGWAWMATHAVLGISIGLWLRYHGWIRGNED